MQRLCLAPVAFSRRFRPVEWPALQQSWCLVRSSKRRRLEAPLRLRIRLRAAEALQIRLRLAVAATRRPSVDQLPRTTELQSPAVTVEAQETSQQRHLEARLPDRPLLGSPIPHLEQVAASILKRVLLMSTRLGAKVDAAIPTVQLPT